MKIPADRVELVLQASDIHVGLAGPGAQHHPGQEGAEHDIQAEPACDRENTANSRSMAPRSVICAVSS